MLYKKVVLIGITLFVLPALAGAASWTNLALSYEYGVGNNIQVQVGASTTGDVGASSSVGAEISSKLSAEENIKILESDLKARDENVARVQSDSDSEVKVEYKHRGRFLAVFPIKVRSTTLIKADSTGFITIETSMPWWNLFVTGTHDINAKVDESLSARTDSVSASANLSSQTEIIKAVISAHAKADTM